MVGKAISILHGRALSKLGVDRVIFPERDMGIRVAHQLVTPNLLDYIEISKDYKIVELTVPACMDGKSLSELNTRAKYGCSIIALNREERHYRCPYRAWIICMKAILWWSSAPMRALNNLRMRL